MLKIENLTFEYIKNTKVLNDFSCEFYNGLNIVFANRGEGKTTLLDLFLFPKKNQTKITLNGENITKEMCKKQMSVITADWFLNEGKTAQENFEKSNYENKLTKNFLAKIGFEEIKRKKISELTICESFKVTIARALKKRPNVLVLDSPFAIRGESEGLIKTLENMVFVYQTEEKRKLCVILLSRPFEVGERVVSLLQSGKIIDKESYQKIQNQPKTTEMALNFAKYKNNVFSKSGENFYVDGDKITRGEEYEGIVESIENQITTISFNDESIQTSLPCNLKNGDKIVIKIPSEAVTLLK